MKTVPTQEQPETERNQKVIQLYSSGKYTYRSLARVFKVTPQRIHQIIKREREAFDNPYGSVDPQNEGVPTLNESVTGEK